MHAAEAWWFLRSFVLREDLSLDYDVGGLGVSATFLIVLASFVVAIAQVGRPTLLFRMILSYLSAHKRHDAVVWVCGQCVYHPELGLYLEIFPAEAHSVVGSVDRLPLCVCRLRVSLLEYCGLCLLLM